MQFILFALKRLLILLADAVSWPFFMVLELWRQPERGRALLLGLPGILIGIISLSAVIYAGTGSKQRFVKKYEDAAKTAAADENWADTVAYLRKLTELKPNDNHVKIRLSDALIQDGRPESIALSTAIVRKLAPDDRPGEADAHVRRALTLLKVRPLPQANVKQAEKQLELAVRSDDQHRNARLELAKLCALTRKYDRAEELYAGLFAEYEGYIFPLIDVMRLQGRGQQARPYLEDAVARYQALVDEQPTNVDFIRRLANCYGHLGDFEKSIEVLEKAIPTFDEERARSLSANLSNVYVGWAKNVGMNADGGLEQDEAARRRFFDLLKSSYSAYPENPNTRIELTRLTLMNVPESELARDLYDPLADPDDAPDAVLQHVGTYEIEHGDLELGISLLQKGIEKNPRNHYILNNLAYALMNSDPQRALRLADDAVNLNRTNPHYLETRGHILMKLDEQDRAINDFERALQLPGIKGSPEYAGLLEKVYLGLISCYQKKGMQTQIAQYEQDLRELKNRVPDSNNR